MVYEWAHLESAVADLVFDLSSLHSEAFYNMPGVTEVASVLHSSLELRPNIEVAKALAFSLDEPELFERLEPCLNRISNEHRTDRNRYVHDRWVISGQRIVRVKLGTRIANAPGSGDRYLEKTSAKDFTSFEEVEDFIARIHRERLELMEISADIQLAYERKYLPQE